MKDRTLSSRDYDRDYFEAGKETGKSLYDGYDYDEVLTRNDVSAILKFVRLNQGESILDFGCAKGVHVMEFRIRGFDAWGCDISRYAIESAHPAIRPYLRRNVDVEIPFDRQFACVVLKDVLEHLTESQVERLLLKTGWLCQNLFAAIPLGDGHRFLVEEYNSDATHILPRSQEWWVGQLAAAGWRAVRLENVLPGMKDDWAQAESGNIGDLYVCARRARSRKVPAQTSYS